MRKLTLPCGSVTDSQHPDDYVRFLTWCVPYYSLTLRQGRELTRRILVFGDGNTVQDAIVTLSAGLPGIEVDIDPESVTNAVVPGGAATLFTFTAEIECVEPGSYVLDWTAVIDAPENVDPTNDILSESTAAECKGRSGSAGRLRR